MKDNLFILFGLLTILSALGVVFSKNAVYSAFSLILGFFGLASLYLLWGSTFISVIQILIYTGAIVVLFVFVVMLLDLGWTNSLSLSQNWFLVGAAGAAVWAFSVLVLRSLNHGLFAPQVQGSTPPDMYQISRLLFTEYLWPFEVLSVFLLAMIIAIYALTRPEASERSL